MTEATSANSPLFCVTANRVTVKGKFLFRNNEKFYLKGVTYGTFQPQENGTQFPPPAVVEKDFALMAQQGLNCVRTYTVPPLYLLNTAQKHQLQVMIGLPWEQHITFLDEPGRAKDILKRVREAVLSCRQHPAILCFSVGNEIPAPIVRWHGKKRTEGFIRQLYQTVKAADPHTLVTYVNYPTTEYLDLGFLDFDCYNVYLETPEKLGTYLARLHHLAGDRPLVLAEIGLDSRRNGEQQQAQTLKWQIETVFSRGCAGLFVFAWTDEWWRGGHDIHDWDFGLVDRFRVAKPALQAVRETMKAVPFSSSRPLPFISVVVCSYNGSATIKDTLDGLYRLDYAHYEVIVVNDGSTDNLEAIVRHYPVQLISTPNRGLSNARNTGWQKARGEIVAFIDDDAYPDPHWLRYLAYAFMHSGHQAVGGPNIAPEGDGAVATCVANAPGGPVQVLLNDEIAEHIPGCNMAFRRSVLEAIGGFDPVYRAAGDDVDVCWRVQQAGHTIGFHPSAVVWHHRRNSLKAYWRQQKGYGKAEALLEAKWPEKYNGLGHLSWAGRIYGNGLTVPLKLKKEKIFYGSGGSALFQSVYQPATGLLSALPLMPEWYLGTLLVGLGASLGVLWAPLLWLWLPFGASLAVLVTQAAASAARRTSLPALPEGEKWKYHLLITLLHLVQPVARLYGRLHHGLTPWRQRGAGYRFRFLFSFRPGVAAHWSEQWKEAETWLGDIEKRLVRLRTRVRKGSDFDCWDLQVRSGLFAQTRLLLAIEEHGSGKQYLKVKVAPRPSGAVAFICTSLVVLTAWAAAEAAWTATVFFAGIALLLAVEYLRSSARLAAGIRQVIGELNMEGRPARTLLIHQQPADAEEQNLPAAEPMEWKAAPALSGPHPLDPSLKQARN
ncbi:glycosyltransferase [Paraflavisolibacter sp. H34]|uniref:glycosyltransferase n=1 Tax=Huijunlia imazamoxiresistens TaxID=3127457 RepID=UPI003019CFC5